MFIKKFELIIFAKKTLTLMGVGTTEFHLPGEKLKPFRNQGGGQQRNS